MTITKESTNMTTQHTPYLLKVLSGSNAGALVRLKVGELLIGRSMSSDIILHDEAIADSHVKLRIDGEDIVLEVLVKPVLIDNREVELGEHTLKPYQVVTLGGIDFFIADVRKPGRRGTEPGQDAGISPNFTEPSHDTAQHAFTAPIESVESSSLATKKRSGFWRWPLLAAGLALLLTANFLFFKPYLIGMAEQLGWRESAQQRAEALLAGLQTPGLNLTREPNGNVSVTGYVQNRDERREFMNKANQIGEGINYRIWVREDLVENAERVARPLGQTDLRFSNLQEGQLAAHGYISSEANWARIKTNIMADVSGIQSIDDKDVQTLIKRRDALVQFIDKKGLSSRVKVTIENDRIKVDGELTQGELMRWSDLYQEFIEVHGVGPAIVENLYDARDRLKLVIRSVSVGDTPFLVSKDGKKYMEGSTLGNNYFIKKITSDHVLLTNNGIEIPIYYGVEDKQ